MRTATCDNCLESVDVSNFSSKHFNLTDEAVCESCLWTLLEDSIYIKVKEVEDNMITVSVIFYNEVALTEICEGEALLLRVLSSMGHEIITHCDDWVTIKNHPPVFMKLKNLPDPMEALSLVTEELWDLLWT